MESKNTTPIIKYFAVGVCVALLFIGGWIVYMYVPEKVEVEQVVKQVGWKTYTDSARGYSFQYPSSWIFDMKPVDPDMLAYVSDVDLDSLPKDREVAIQSFSVLSKFADCEYADKPVTFAGKYAMETSWGPAMTEEWRYICFNDGMAIILTAYEANQKAVLETILSTFKFTK